MTLPVDSALGIPSQTVDFEAQTDVLLRRHGNMLELSFLSVWELQSHIASIVLIALVALVPLPIALFAMIAWALAAALIYHHGRRRGFPDLLETRWVKPRVGGLGTWARSVACSILKVCLAGLQPFIYSRIAAIVFARPADALASRIIRVLFLGIGLTLFGVTAAHHLLRRAGLADDRVLKLSIVGPFLNVPYRVAWSAVSSILSPVSWRGPASDIESTLRLALRFS